MNLIFFICAVFRFFGVSFIGTALRIFGILFVSTVSRLLCIVLRLGFRLRIFQFLGYHLHGSDNGLCLFIPAGYLAVIFFLCIGRGKYNFSLCLISFRFRLIFPGKASGSRKAGCCKIKGCPLCLFLQIHLRRYGNRPLLFFLGLQFLYCYFYGFDHCLCIFIPPGYLRIVILLCVLWRKNHLQGRFISRRFCFILPCKGSLS